VSVGFDVWLLEGQRVGAAAVEGRGCAQRRRRGRRVGGVQPSGAGTSVWANRQERVRASWFVFAWPEAAPGFERDQVRS